MSTTINIRNPRFLADGRIDCEIEHPSFGWVPFTASATDSTEHGRAIHAAAIAMVPAPYVAQPPAEPVVPQVVTRRQARQALLLSGRLQDVQPAIDAIADPVQRGMVQIEWDDAQEFRRDWPSLNLLASAIGMTSADLDELFVQAGGL